MKCARCSKTMTTGYERPTHGLLCDECDMSVAEEEGKARQPYVRSIKIITCNCGKLVSCAHFTNTCEGCGRDYNFGGSVLAPREQWGEETGEHWTDCVGPFDGSELDKDW